MKKTACYLSAILLLASCTTIPERIDDKYLVDRTQHESELLSGIEKDIIAKNRAKQASDEVLEAKKRDMVFTEKEIELLEKEYWILIEQVNLYTKYSDARNLEVRKARLAENEDATKKKRALTIIQKAEIKLAEADLEVKQADLAVSVAELEFEKSKIAATYRDKTESVNATQDDGDKTPAGDEKKQNDKYGYQKYGEFLEKMKDNLKKAREKYSDAEKKLAETREKTDAAK